MIQANVKDRQWVKMCIYGQPGVGKSSLGVTAPNPMFLLSEVQGVLHIRQAALRLGVPCPPVMLMSALNDYKAVLRALNGNRSEPFVLRADDTAEELYRGEWPETIVIDSLTDAGRLLSMGESEKEERDGFKRWELITKRMQNLIIAFRNAPVHVVYLCLSEDRTTGEGEAAVRSIAPELPTRRLSQFLASTCNIMGYAGRREVATAEGVQVAYGVTFSSSDTYMLKSTDGLRKREPADVSRWIKVIRSEIQPEGLATKEEAKNEV